MVNADGDIVDTRAGERLAFERRAQQATKAIQQQLAALKPTSTPARNSVIYARACSIVTEQLADRLGTQYLLMDNPTFSKEVRKVTLAAIIRAYREAPFVAKATALDPHFALRATLESLENRNEELSLTLGELGAELTALIAPTWILASLDQDFMTTLTGSGAEGQTVATWATTVYNAWLKRENLLLKVAAAGLPSFASPPPCSGFQLLTHFVAAVGIEEVRKIHHLKRFLDNDLAICAMSFDEVMEVVRDLTRATMGDPVLNRPLPTNKAKTVGSLFF